MNFDKLGYNPFEPQMQPAGEMDFERLGYDPFEGQVETAEVHPSFGDPPHTRARRSQTAFARIFRKFRVRAGVDRDIRFSNRRRTALSELGESGAAETEIVPITGRKHG